MIFAEQEDIEIEGNRFHLFLYLDKKREAIELERFLKELLEIESELRYHHKRKPFNDVNEAKEFIKNIRDSYAKYFDIAIERSNLIVKRKEELITEIMSRMGKMILITNSDKLNKEEALSPYRRRNEVERIFNAMKNTIDGERLRSHSAETASGKLFIFFISLIIYSALDKLINENNLYDKYTLNKLLEALKKIRTVELESGPVYLTEVSKKERTIYEILGINIPIPP